MCIDKLGIKESELWRSGILKLARACFRLSSGLTRVFNKKNQEKNESVKMELIPKLVNDVFPTS